MSAWIRQNRFHATIPYKAYIFGIPVSNDALIVPGINISETLLIPTLKTPIVKAIGPLLGWIKK